MINKTAPAASVTFASDGDLKLMLLRHSLSSYFSVQCVPTSVCSCLFSTRVTLARHAFCRLLFLGLFLIFTVKFMNTSQGNCVGFTPDYTHTRPHAGGIIVPGGSLKLTQDPITNGRHHCGIKPTTISIQLF